MALDLLTFGEALVEVMRTEVGQPLDRPGLFTGPYPSGAPFIFATQAARLGASVGVVGAVGRDPFGDCLLSKLRDDGIDPRGVHMLDDHPTGVAFVAYNADGSRDFVFHIKGAAAGQLSPDMLDETLFDGLKCLHLMGSTLCINDAAYETGLKALELAQKHDVTISFDPNLRPELLPIDQARHKLAPFVAAADVLLPTYDEITALFDAYGPDEPIHDMLDDKPTKMIIVTEGELGCSVHHRIDPHDPFFADVPSQSVGRMVTPVGGYRVTEVDPTGAGDCFDAAFLTRWLGSDSPVDAAQFANACGALAVTAQGPMAGARTLADVREFMRTHEPIDPETWYAGDFDDED